MEAIGTEQANDDELARLRQEKAKQMLTGAGAGTTARKLPGDGKPVHVESVEHFKELLEKYSDVPILIDFWAEWCGPCKMLGPVYEKVAGEFKDKALFLKVNSDQHQSLSAYFRVSSIPVVFMIHKQEVKANWVGLRPFEFYKGSVDKFLSSISG